MVRDFRRDILTAAALVGLAAEAGAGAWTLDAGTGQAIATVGASRSTSRFDHRGDGEETARFDKAEGNLLVEYGVSDRFTLKGKLEGEALRFEERPENDRAGLGFSEIGGRFRLFERGGFVGSLEASTRIGLADHVPGLDDDGRRVASEYEARALAGYGFQVGAYPAFVNGEVAYRVRDGIGADEIRVDVTAGARPVDDVLLLLQSLSTVGLHRPEAEILGYKSYKAQASAVYDVTEALSVQGGGFTSVAGRDSFAEDGVFAAVWYRF